MNTDRHPPGFRIVLVLVVAVLGTGLAAACGGGSKNPAANVTFTGLSPIATKPSTDTPTPSPTSSPTPSPTATPDPRTAAYNAALKLLNAIPAADCSNNSPSKQSCLNWSTTPSTPALGVAAFNVGSPDGGAALIVLGLEADGHTWGRWFGTQQQLYQAVSLPASMIVCAGGRGLVEHQQPSDNAPVVQTIADGSTVKAEQFVLTAPGSASTSGAGWYRLSSPAAGWAPATALSVASLGDCSLHDALQGNTFDRG